MRTLPTVGSARRGDTYVVTDMGPVQDLPVVVMVPARFDDPLIIIDDLAAVRCALVEREGRAGLNEYWDAPGVYVLIDQVSEDGSWGAYVGKAATSLKSRLRQHVEFKESWARALLVRRDTTNGFSSSDVGWLESRLHELLLQGAYPVLSNKQEPPAGNIPVYNQTALEQAAQSCLRALRAVGYRVDTEDAPRPAKPQKPRVTRTAEHAARGPQRPDAVMERLSKWLEQLGKDVSWRGARSAPVGKSGKTANRETLDLSLAILRDEGYISWPKGEPIHFLKAYVATSTEDHLDS